MDRNLNDLIEISQFYGRNKEYVIAGGGNTSYKNEKFLWVKASGVALSNISEDGFVKMSRDKLKIISSATYSNDSSTREAEVKEDMMKAIVSGNGLRPSVETSLHEIIGYPFVIHTHPTLVNALLCSEKARENSFKLLGEDILFIPYIDPGYILFKYVSVALKEFNEKNGFDPKIILLENHGIFVSGETIQDVKDNYFIIEKVILENATEQLPAEDIIYEDFHLKAQLDSFFGNSMVIKEMSNELIQKYIGSKEAFQRIQTAFTPDHIVYCKARYLFYDPDTDDVGKELNKFRDSFGYLPKIIGVKNKGLILIDEDEAAVKIIKELIMNMMKISFYAQSFGGSKPMNDEQIAFIENWEAENYRKKMAQKK